MKENHICDFTEQKISEYQDGELSPAEAEGVEKHLETCEACRQLLAEYREITALMKEALSEEPSRLIDQDALWEKIQPNIQCKPSLWDRFLGWVRVPFVWAPAAVATAAAVLFFVVVPFQNTQTPLATSRVESVYSSSGMVMVLKTPQSGQPLVWIMNSDNNKSEA